MSYLSEILKRAREDSELTQIDVRNKTGINNKTLSGYENGISEPDIDTLIRLFRLYGLSADSIFHLNEIPEAPREKIERLSHEEVSHLALFRKLTPAERDHLSRTAELLLLARQSHP